MEQTTRVSGYRAIGSGAIAAGCDLFPGCPSYPDDPVFEQVARDFIGNGKQFIRASSEVSAINMAYGSVSTGGRAMTLVSGEGWGLIQETMSNLVNAYLPMVVVYLQQGGPGAGSLGPSQMDYVSVTHGAGHGNYRMISLAPYSVQEIHDFMQIAFYLADKYRNPVIIATESSTINLEETIEARTLEFDQLPEKDWILRGIGNQPDLKRRVVCSGQGFIPMPAFPTYLHLLEGIDDKVRRMRENESRYETYSLDDARIVLVAYGSSARSCEKALEKARSAGTKAGMVRLQTLWPFPSDILKKKAKDGAKFISVEDSLSGLDEDVRFAVEDNTRVETINMLDRVGDDAHGVIEVETIFKKIKESEGGS